MDEQTVLQNYQTFMTRLRHLDPSVANVVASSLAVAAENETVDTTWQTYQTFMAMLRHLPPGVASGVSATLAGAVHQAGTGAPGQPPDLSEYVLKAGDTMTGQLATTAGDPVDPDDLSRKAYVDSYVQKAGDTLTGALNFQSNDFILGPPPGNLRINNIAMAVEGEVRATVFVTPTDPGGYAFGTVAQDGGLYKKLGGGLVLRQSSGNQHIEIESNDGSEHWEIFDARGGGFRKDGTAPGSFGLLSWYERDGGQDTVLAQLYAGRRTDTNEPQILVRLPGQAQEFLWRSRIGTDGGPRLLLYHEPEVPMDAATKQYVDAALAPLQARIAELEAQLAAKSST